MSRKKGGHHEEHMDESWLIPYADLLTLLLALFIVLFAASNVDKDKFNAIAEALGGAFGTHGTKPGGDSELAEMDPKELEEILKGIVTPGNEDPENPDDGIGGSGSLEMEDMKKLQNVLDEYFASAGMANNITTSIDIRGLVISLNNAVTFDLGSASLKNETKEILIKIGTIISQFDNYIRVDGYTDNLPIKTLAYPSNWELSSARASSVVRFLTESCNVNPYKISCVGHAEYKPLPGVDENSNEGRAANRRVDIIIMNTQFNGLENPADYVAEDDLGK